MNKTEILDHIYSNKVIAVVRLNGSADVIKVVNAIINGGIKTIELTLTTPNAYEIIKELTKISYNNALIGAGSVLDSEMAVRAINSGAQYIVSPVSNLDLIDLVHSKNLPIMLGAYSPTEIFLAQQKGADIIKVFPADGLGMEYFKAIKAPMPHLNIMPTGGVTLFNVGNWLKAGAVVVGIGSAVVTQKLADDKDYLGIEKNAKTVMDSLLSLF